MLNAYKLYAYKKVYCLYGFLVLWKKKLTFFEVGRNFNFRGIYFRELNIFEMVRGRNFRELLLQSEIRGI